MEKALEAQMMDIINDVKKNANLLKNSACVVDVSGSMTCKVGNTTPYWVALALGLVVSEI